jgi:hypothetical protein
LAITTSRPERAAASATSSLSRFAAAYGKRPASLPGKVSFSSARSDATATGPSVATLETWTILAASSAASNRQWVP